MLSRPEARFSTGGQVQKMQAAAAAEMVSQLNDEFISERLMSDCVAQVDSTSPGKNMENNRDFCCVRSRRLAL